jgi:hypothetical protein
MFDEQEPEQGKLIEYIYLKSMSAKAVSLIRRQSCPNGTVMLKTVGVSPVR